MVTSSIHPFEIWVGTSMSFSSGGTSPPNWANRAFTHGCAFEHIGTPFHPLPSYQYLEWKSILSLRYEIKLSQNLHSIFLDFF